MGDMADFFLEHVEDMEEARFEYRSGSMSDFEAYELGIIDEMGFYIGPKYGKDRSDEMGFYIGPKYGKDRSRVCRCCNKGGLLWGKVGDKFRLFENGVIHRCPANPLANT